MTDSSKKITILQLYPIDMNIYGDNGNVLTLKRRLEWSGYSVEVIEHNPGDNLPESVDIIVGGGGQDSGQSKIHQDLLKIGPQLQQWADDGLPMLVVCGLYQLFGRFFQTYDGDKITGIEIFDAETYAGDERLIGNIVATSSEFGEIIGYENHSGQTYLGEDAEALATVIRGAGNNLKDGHEGARYKNVIGTYLHGSVLPKNPQLADFLISKAVDRRYSEQFDSSQIDDTYAQKAREVARSRPR